MTTTLSPYVSSELLAGPAGTPPPGVTPNLVDAPNIQLEGRDLLIVGLIIMAFPLALRIFTQWWIAKSYVIEDFFVLLAVGITGAQVYADWIDATANYSAGYHMWDRTLGTFLKGQRFVNYSTILYCPAIALVKIGILVQLQRIFAPTRRTNPWLWFGCWAWILITLIYYTIEMFLYIFECWPRQKIWEPWVTGHCIPGSNQLLLASSFFNVFSDILILALPVPTIRQLNMKKKKKLFLGALFATAGLACAASVIRLYYSFVIVNGPDVSWNYVALGVSSLFEESIGVLVFCLPVMPKLVRFLRDKSRAFFSQFRRDSCCATSERTSPQQPICAEPQRGNPRQMGVDISLGISSIGKYLGPKKNSLKAANELSL